MSKSKEKHRSIKDRLYNLPYHLVLQVNKNISEQNIPQKTYYRVLVGQSENFRTLSSIANVLGCTIEQLVDPGYDFEPDKVLQGKIQAHKEEIIHKRNLAKP